MWLYHSNLAIPLLLVIVLATAGSVAFSEEPSEKKPTYPLWDGSESVADYAKKVNLPPTKTLDLGNGVKLELVLIPAGKFVMGTQEPQPVDEEEFHSRILTGQALLVVSSSCPMSFEKKMPPAHVAGNSETFFCRAIFCAGWRDSIEFAT